MKNYHVVFAVLCLMFSLRSLAHSGETLIDTLTIQVQTFIKSLDNDQKKKAIFLFHDEERLNFHWWPKIRKGVPLNDLDDQQTDLLKAILHKVLSRQGVIKVDHIMATEAVLGIIENDPERRDPGKYYLTLFGHPDQHEVWGLRFEGHHLSINLTFEGNKMIAASPLFLGANPETVSHGPHAGLRALAGEVDQAFTLFQSLSPSQQDQAQSTHTWFEGFLTSPGDRDIHLGKPAGVSVSTLNVEQSKHLVSLLREYLGNMLPSYATPYLEQIIAEEWKGLYFYWKGAKNKSSQEDYYYRIAGQRLFIEHIGFSGGSHIHAIWRDQQQDFGKHLFH